LQQGIGGRGNWIHASRRRNSTAATSSAPAGVSVRPVNTGLGAVFVLVALVALGGDSLVDLALALLIDVGWARPRRCSWLRRWSPAV
jgi:hypothetical protein